MSTVFSVDDNEGKQILKPSYEKSGKKRNITKNDYLPCGIKHIQRSQDFLFWRWGGRGMKMY